ncbi:hypothetical protein CIPAW_06G142200 [Carya illinoinensis]|uniref:Uncharacterized protein n=1 Tax=Carya illinoinensis TaxID=32201 RepID=A0A8T1QBV7_CARIL|nr:hypothetical protein CIPAW_06G142200 [Carya illinoinensis]
MGAHLKYRCSAIHTSSSFYLSWRLTLLVGLIIGVSEDAKRDIIRCSASSACGSQNRSSLIHNILPHLLYFGSCCIVSR